MSPEETKKLAVERDVLSCYYFIKHYREIFVVFVVMVSLAQLSI